MLTRIFKKGDWVIYTHDYAFQLGHKYFSQHTACDPPVVTKALLDWDWRRCTDCRCPIPDHIQALMLFLEKEE